MKSPRRLKRVLFAAGLDPSMKYSSTEEQVFLMACAFQEQSSLFLPVYQAKLSSESAAEYKAADLAVDDLDFTRFRFATLTRLLNILRQQKIEVIHWNFYSPLFNWYVWWLTLLRPQLEHYFTDHASRTSLSTSSEAPLKANVKRLLFRRYRKVLTGSDYMVECLHNDQTWTDPARWYYCVNTNRFRPDPEVRSRVRRQLRAENQFVSLFVGNLIKQKGVDIVLHALNMLPKHFVLWIVGGGEEAENLEALCRELSLTNRVQFLGLQRCVEPYMQASDCLVCPSVWVEAAGQVNMEALSCELPVIASRIGGIPEFVDDGRTGFLFRAGDAEDCAQKLRLLAHDPASLKQMATAARSAAVERFSIQKRMNECLDLYRI